MRELARSPRPLPLYTRALAALMPGASMLPWVPGGGGAMPETRLALTGVRAQRDHLNEYLSLCEFSARRTLPATYVHVLAFPLHLALMTDGSFPFPAVGLVHTENRIVQHQPIPVDEPLELEVRASQPAEHPRGSTFALLSAARIDGTLAWEETSTMLHRAKRPPRGTPVRVEPRIEPVGPDVRRGLAGDLGRRYAAVSGDRNPIHTHTFAAKALGFPGPIAHGMWTAAWTLASLEPSLPSAFTFDVAFRTPARLPCEITLSKAVEWGAVEFRVRLTGSGRTHLAGRAGGELPEDNQDSEEQ